MAQAVSRRPLTAAAQVRVQVNPVGFVVDKVALGQVFLRVLWFSHQYHSTMGSNFPKIKKNTFHSFTPSLILIWRWTKGLQKWPQSNEMSVSPPLPEYQNKN
jgi:hypothetical protein